MFPQVIRCSSSYTQATKLTYSHAHLHKYTTIETHIEHAYTKSLKNHWNSSNSILSFFWWKPDIKYSRVPVPFNHLSRFWGMVSFLWAPKTTCDTYNFNLISRKPLQIAWIFPWLWESIKIVTHNKMVVRNWDSLSLFEVFWNTSKQN